MPDDDPTGSTPVYHDTAELLAVGLHDENPDPLGDLDGWSDDEEWVAAKPVRGIQLRWPTAILLVLLLAAGGFYGGVELQKHHGSSTTVGRSGALAALRSATRGGFGGATGAGGTGAAGTGNAAGGSGRSGGTAAAAAGITAGTVTDVNGDILYVTNAAGNAVTVKVTKSTTVTRNAKSTLSSLRPGDTVIVRGTANAKGTVTAGTITATAQGVSAGFGGGLGGGGGLRGGGGFGGFGGRGGAGG